jgi:hypothetical protein
MRMRARRLRGQVLALASPRADRNCRVKQTKRKKRTPEGDVCLNKKKFKKFIQALVSKVCHVGLETVFKELQVFEQQ